MKRDINAFEDDGIIIIDDMGSEEIDEWTIVNDKHPKFNQWKRTFQSGNSYMECFWKGINPNKIMVSFDD